VVYLPSQRNSGPNTIRASLEMLLDFVKQQNKKPLYKVSFHMPNEKTVSEFLDSLETERGGGKGITFRAGSECEDGPSKSLPYDFGLRYDRACSGTCGFTASGITAWQDAYNRSCGQRFKNQNNSAYEACGTPSWPLPE
jgi:hypothetical protein